MKQTCIPFLNNSINRALKNKYPQAKKNTLGNYNTTLEANDFL